MTPDDELTAVLRERLRHDPSAWATILRHAIPIAGVIYFGWSALEALVLLVLDAWSVLLCLAGVGTTFVVRDMIHDEMGFIDRANLLVGGFLAFLLVGALLGFALGVPAAMLLSTVAGGDGDQLLAVVADRTLLATFAGMLLFQLPRYRGLVARFDSAAARDIVQPQVGFVLIRMALIASAGMAFRILPARAAQLAALVVAQAMLALSEIVADRLLTSLGAAERGAADARPAARRRRPKLR